MARHRRRKARSKYVGRHRSTYSGYNDMGKRASGVLALSAVLSISPLWLGYQVVESPLEGMSIVPPPVTRFLEEIWGEVILDIPDEEPPVDL